MRIGIISTYPVGGSQNIGDLLITECTEAAIRKVVGHCSIESYYRADDWDSVYPRLKGVDRLVFACLAIRENGMFSKVYPYAERLMSLQIPYVVLSAGTELEQTRRENYDWAGSAQELRILERLLSQAVGVSTRGILSQRFVSQFHQHSNFFGDIAFYDERFDGRIFKAGSSIRRIAISDPHYWSSYYRPMLGLRQGLQEMFPDAKIDLVLHGKSGLRAKLDRDGISYIPIYEEGGGGLDFYDDVDLHVGFRVHGHVAALKRRKYSYLLEQDGRGADYGASLNVNSSASSYLTASPLLSRVSRVLNQVQLSYSSSSRAGCLPRSIFRILSMVSEHAETGFDHFVGLERQLDHFNHSNLAFLRSCLMPQMNSRAA